MASNRQQNIKVNEIVMNGILSIIDNKNSTWQGTMTELSSALSRNLGRKQSQMLPGSPSALRVAVNRVVNRIRARGISVRFARTTDHMRTRFVKFAR